MDVLNALAAHPLLKGASPDVIESLRGRVRWHHLPGGRQLMAEGDLPLGVYADRGACEPLAHSSMDPLVSLVIFFPVKSLAR